MALSADSMRCGEFRTTYKADTTIFPTPRSRNFALAGLLMLLVTPFIFESYIISLLIQIGYYSIAALGLNILVGSTGQISIGHGAFFGVGAFGSAWLNNSLGIPVILAIPLAGGMAAAVGLVAGIPALRIKGLYLAIATLAAQFILEDMFSRAVWFTGGPAGSMASELSIFGYNFNSDQSYFYIVLLFLVVMFLAGTNMLRSRDGRAFVAVRDHYLSAEIMGINLAKYRVLSFGVAAFYAGIGGALFAHYLGYVSSESFTLMLSIQLLGMIIIGGLGSVMGTLLGVTFMVLLPEVMDGVVDVLGDVVPSLVQGSAYLKQMAIGLAIVLFLIFEPDGLAHRWKQIKAYWKLYPFSY